MPGKLSFGRFILCLAGASITGLVSYFLICSALRPYGWVFSALSDAERYFAIGLSIVICVAVFYRMLRRSWGSAQMKKLLDFDDTGLG